MPTMTDEPIKRLVINSSPMSFRSATLHRVQGELPGGEPGSTDWSIEIVDGSLPEGDDHFRVELTADGGSYSGAAEVVDDGREAERVTLVGNGPLLAGEAGPLLD